MIQYKAKTFDIPKIEGISEKQIEEHLKLYNGYVTHANKIMAQLEEWKKDREKNGYVISELRRRFGFEFDGIRSHEYYFGAIEGSPSKLSEDLSLGAALAKQFGSLDAWMEDYKSLCMTRGVGWAVLYYHPIEKHFIHVWVDEHHLGQLSSLPMVFATDCWEHAYMVDYLPGERGKYIDSYLNAVNWKEVDNWYQMFVHK